MTCRYYGISRQVFYTWLRRYDAEGPAGLRDRSTRPAHCPHETPAGVVAKIIYLRTNYHFGPAKIAMYLKRYPRRRDQHLRRLADPQAAGPEPAPGLAAVQAHRPEMEAVREADARSRRPGRRQVHRPVVELEPQEVLPVHRHRRLHPHPGAADLRQAQPEDRHRSEE